jgi:thiamine-phosphate diphosphorylase
MVRLLVLTDRTQCAASLPVTVAELVDCGARAVVVREKDLPEAERRDLVERLRPVLDRAGGLLVVAGRAGSAVHLSAADAFPAPRPVLVGRSCHTAAEVARASAEACDYITVSPVYASASKPGYGPALGVDGLGALCRDAPPAVYALGGVLPEHVAGCLAAGAYGVAVMGPLMREPKLVTEYLEALL